MGSDGLLSEIYKISSSTINSTIDVSIFHKPVVNFDSRADAVMKQYVKAKGGINNIQSIKNIRMIGIQKAYVFNQSKNILFECSHPDQARFEFGSHQGHPINIVSGEQGWTLSSSQSTNGTRGEYITYPIAPDTALVMRSVLDVLLEIPRYPNNQFRVEYGGSEEINGTQTHKIYLLKPDGSIITMFIDPKTSIGIKYLFSSNVNNEELFKEIEVRGTILSSGVSFPETIVFDLGIKSHFIIKDIQTNVSLSGKNFTPK